MKEGLGLFPKVTSCIHHSSACALGKERPYCSSGQVATLATCASEGSEVKWAGLCERIYPYTCAFCTCHNMSNFVSYLEWQGEAR